MKQSNLIHPIFSQATFLIIFLSFLSLQNRLLSQDCGTEGLGSTYSNSLTEGQTISYCVRLYFHIIRDDNGSGGVASTRIDTMLDILEDGFSNNPYINFWWDETIDYIDSTKYYNPSSWTNFMFWVKYVNPHSDGVDIYIGDDNWDSENGGAQAHGHVNGGPLSIGFIGTLRDTLGVVSAGNVVVHEMGHILGLDHPFYGTDEFVDGSNCETAGDKLCDTPASPGESYFRNGIDFEVSDPPECEWQVYLEDAHDDPFDPLTDNYMDYTKPECMESFTDGQVDRMRTAMEEADYLDGTVSSAIFGVIDYTSGNQNLVTVNFVPEEESTTTIMALGCDEFDWDDYDGSAVYWNTNANGTELDLELEESGSISFLVSYESFCYGNQSLTFVHSGGWFSTYPNPTNDCFTIEADDDFQYSYTDAFNQLRSIDVSPAINNYFVYDNSGNLIKSQVNASGLKSTKVCLSGQKSGVYYIEVNRGEKLRYNTKIIKS